MGGLVLIFNFCLNLQTPKDRPLPTFRFLGEVNPTASKPFEVVACPEAGNG